jgi:acyl carrier protein
MNAAPTPELINDIRSLIVTTLCLEGVTAADIDPEAPLFGEGLGLDSIDALELGIAVQKKYGIEIDPNDPVSRVAFANVNTLAQHITAPRP